MKYKGDRRCQCHMMTIKALSLQFTCNLPHKYDLDLIHVGICHTLSNKQTQGVV